MTDQPWNQPPAGGYGAPPAGGYGAPPAGGYGAPPTGYGAPPPGGYAQSQQPGEYGAPAGGYGAPPVGGYGAPPSDQYGAPPPVQYGVPPPGQYGAPPPGQYGAPPPVQYGAPPPGQYGVLPQGQFGLSAKAGSYCDKFHDLPRIFHNPYASLNLGMPTCNICTESIVMSQFGLFHCSQCNYDLCQNCENLIQAPSNKEDEMTPSEQERITASCTKILKICGPIHLLLTVGVVLAIMFEFQTNKYMPDKRTLPTITASVAGLCTAYAFCRYMAWMMSNTHANRVGYNGALVLNGIVSFCLIFVTLLFMGSGKRVCKGQYGKCSNEMSVDQLIGVVCCVFTMLFSLTMADKAGKLVKYNDPNQPENTVSDEKETLIQ